MPAGVYYSMPYCAIFILPILIMDVPALEGYVYAYTNSTPNTTMIFEDLPSMFGYQLQRDGLPGYLVFAKPENACVPIAPPPSNTSLMDFIVVIRRYGCNFDVKVLQAQLAGYKAAIVHNVDSDQLLSMRWSNDEIRRQITIPSVFIGTHASQLMKSLFTYDKGCKRVMCSSSPSRPRVSPSRVTRAGPESRPGLSRPRPESPSHQSPPGPVSPMSPSPAPSHIPSPSPESQSPSRPRVPVPAQSPRPVPRSRVPVPAQSPRPRPRPGPESPVPVPGPESPSPSGPESPVPVPAQSPRPGPESPSPSPSPSRPRIVRCVQYRRRIRRNRLSKDQLKKLPVHKFSKGDAYDVCAICLDEYEEGDRLRVLPCSHAYHCKCVDTWLTQTHKTCPVCKQRVLRSASDSDSETETAGEENDERESERTPLLQASSSSGPHTFGTIGVPHHGTQGLSQSGSSCVCTGATTGGSPAPEHNSTSSGSDSGLSSAHVYTV
ncbi:E3 ubiquitin-protein ligase RNF167-like [Leucoraja erinacea]|uniref:E3 ubiquitin-protein ligase RNF167-like n=1 Tax=Leucoraja erinaceus TaxID=7782 RepID=UPI002455CDA3|nr:E3 ubiquitin-protein ligase RNF167-like [Leucoraja erinacea]